MATILLRAGFIVSGAVGLVFEIVWFRYLGIESGDLSLSVAVITAAYMGGLALGGWLGGHLVDRNGPWLLAYTVAQVVVVLGGLALPAVAREAVQLGVAVPPLGTGVGWLIAGLALMVPTTAMGMGLPLLTRGLAAAGEQAAREASLLYGVNTLGAMLGALWAGFLGIPSLGLEVTNGVAIVAQLIVAVTAAVCLLGVTRHAAAVPDLRVAAASRKVRWDAALVATVAGAAAMAVQVAWTSWLAIGAAAEAFSLTVVVYLLGLSAGALVVARGLGRARSPLAVLSDVLAGITAGVGLATVCLAYFFDPESAAVGWTMVLLPATIGMGMVFPLLVRTVIDARGSVGAAVGTTGAFGTVGSVSGSLAGGMLATTVGPARTLFIALLVYALLTVLVGRWFVERPSRRAWWLPTVGLVAVSVWVLLGEQTPNPLPLLAQLLS